MIEHKNLFNTVAGIREECFKRFSSQSVINNYQVSDIKAVDRFFLIKNISAVLNNEDLMHTVMVFFDSNLNSSSASRDGFMHRNTLVYRIEKIKKMIGIDLRIFNEAVIFFNIMNYYKNKLAKEQDEVTKVI